MLPWKWMAEPPVDTPILRILDGHTKKVVGVARTIDQARAMAPALSDKPRIIWSEDKRHNLPEL